MPQGRPRGGTYNLTFATQKIDQATSGLNGIYFTIKEISKVTGLNGKIVKTILGKKNKKGLLERIRPGCYRRVPGKNLAITLPSAFVATKVWAILSQPDKPLIHREISEIIEKETGLNTYFTIGILLYRWYHDKVLDKIGNKKPYAYQIKPEYKGKSRPSTSLLL